MLRVLYVDDEPSLLEIGKIFLEVTEGLTVDTISSADDALAILPHQQYDAIISDYQMPGTDGIAFLKAVRSSGYPTPFILFTGRGREEIVIEAINNGADFYLQKGGDPRAQFAELAHKVRQAVQKRKADATILDHERREADILNFLPDATFAIDTNGIIISWNRAIEEMTGVPASEMLGKGEYEYAIPFYGTRRKILIDLVFESEEVIAETYAHIIHENNVLIADTTLALPRGKTCTLMGKASPLYNQVGEVVGAIESIRDITEKKLAEDALRESERRFRDLADMLPQVVFETDAGGTITYANRIAFDLFGYSQDELDEGLNVLQMIAPADRERGMNALSAVQTGGVPGVHGKEYEAQRKDGSTFSIYLSYSPVIVNDRVAGFRGIIIDMTEHRRANEALKESEEKYRAVFETTGAGTIIFDEDNVIVLANAGFSVLSGYSVEELVGNHRWTDFIVEDDLKRMREYHDGRLDHRGSVPSVYEFRFIDRAGTIRYGINHVTVIPGTRLSISSTVDITERRWAEDALRESERLYRSVIENSQDVYYRSNLDGNLVLVSPSAATILGYDSVDEMLGKPVAETFYYDPADKALFLSSLQKTGAVSNFDTRLKKKDGSFIDVSTNSQYFYDQSGAVAGIEGTVRDISERKQAEEELQKSEEKFRSLIDNSLDGMVITDLDGMVLYANPRIGEIIEATSSQDLAGRANILDFVSPSYRDQAADDLARVQAGADNFPVSYTLTTLGDNEIWVECIGRIISFESRPALLLSIRDITFRKLTELALKRANDKIGLLYQITRHDILNQLMVIDSYSVLLGSSLADSPRDTALLENIRLASSRIKEQISFTKDYQDLGKNEPVWLDIPLIARMAADGVIPETVTLDTVGGEVEVMADPMLLLVVYNLFENAMRHGKTVTRIAVGFQENKKEGLLIIEDNGIGIPDASKARVFERGFGSNTGLGLFLAREILGITGITISETGQEGSGARFEMIVPPRHWRRRPEAAR